MGAAPSFFFQNIGELMIDRSLSKEVGPRPRQQHSFKGNYLPIKCIYVFCGLADTPAGCVQNEKCGVDSFHTAHSLTNKTRGAVALVRLYTHPSRPGFN